MNRQKERKTPFLFLLLFRLCLIVLPFGLVVAVSLSIYIPLSLRSAAAPMGFTLLEIKQTESFMYGDDDMLTAGDTIEITTFFNNLGTTTIPSVQLITSVPMSMCFPSTNASQLIIGDMAPGASAFCSSIITITQIHIAQQQIPATFSYTTGVGAVPLVQDPNSTIHGIVYPFQIPLNTSNITSNLAIDFSETIDFGEDMLFSVGDTLVIVTTLTNTGTQTLLNISTVESNGTVSQLLPGQSIQFSTNYTLTSNDILSGMFTIQESAVGTGITDLIQYAWNASFTANFTVPELGNIELNQFTPSISQVRFCPGPGDTIMISLMFNNSSTETLTDVSVTDNKIGSGWVCGPSMMNNMLATVMPGEVFTCSGSYLVGAVDMPTGEFLSDIVVQGTHFSTQLPYERTFANNSYQFTDPTKDVRFIATIITTNSVSVPWAAVVYNTHPANWASNTFFTIPVTGTYRISARYWDAVCCIIAEIRVDGVAVPATYLGTAQRTVTWTGTVNAGQTVYIADPSGAGNTITSPMPNPPQTWTSFCITQL